MNGQEQLLENIKIAATTGEKVASAALSKLSGKSVKVETKAATLADATEMQDVAKLTEEDTIIAYTQAIAGLEGASLLSMSRDQGLMLVDLFNGRELGTTHVMKELDRSTIREALNILANAYVTELSKLEKTLITLDVPRLVTRSGAEKLVEKIVVHEDEKAVLFETTMTVEELDIEVSLYFHFYFMAKPA